MEPAELEALLGHEDTLAVDLSQPATYAEGHIPGAVYLPYDQIVSTQGSVVGLLCDPEDLGRALSAVGVTPDTHVVAYCDQGNTRAARLLWTLDAVGHRSFSLLNGGLAAWKAEDRPLEARAARPHSFTYRVSYEPRGAVVADRHYVLEHLCDRSVVLLDARSQEEYDGTTEIAEQNGHIPGAVHIEWTRAVAAPAGDQRLKPPRALRRLYEGQGVTPDKEVITYCWSHERSAHSYIVLKSLGYPRVRGYPGAWSDWGNSEETPVEPPQCKVALCRHRTTDSGQP